jgi:WD40 repeat protein
LVAQSQQASAEAKAVGLDHTMLRGSPYDLLQRSALLDLESLKRVPLFEATQELRPTIALWPQCVLHRENYPGILSLAVSPDDRRLVSTDVNDNAILFDISSGKELARFQNPSTERILFSPDGRYFALGGNLTEMRWHLFHSGDGRPLATSMGQGAGAMAFSPNSNFILLGKEDGSVRVHDIPTGREISIVNPTGEAKQGVSAVSVSLDRSGRHMVFAGAGHPPCMVIKPGANLQLLEARSMMLGALSNAVCDKPTIEIDLEPGDRILLYTDGITEVFDDQGEMLGVEGL